MPRAPLGDMSLIDQPFKRVAINLVGPIVPASNKGHRHMLTLVDYATRYPEAVSLKNIETETVAEALLDMYSRVHQIFIIFQKTYGSVIFLFSSQKNDDM